MERELVIRVEAYQFIDNLQHIIPPKQVFEDSAYESIAEKVRKAFYDAGWEGDGELGLIWLPPFLFENGDTFGEYVWHVKQYNNGVSFLGYMEYRLPNPGGSAAKAAEEWRDVTITESLTNYVKNRAEYFRGLLADVEENAVKADISSLYPMLLNSIQNQAVAEFIDYIDEIYLQLAEHVLGQDNPDKIKLTKAKVNLPLDEISSGIEDGYVDSWLTLKTITGALWRDFKFWPFREKIKEICACVGFTCPDHLKSHILKHIEIRNAIQHHNGQFTRDMQKALGRDKLEIFTDEHTKTALKVWGYIELTPYEINSFLDSIEAFADEYENHISQRMKTRMQTRR